LAALYGHYHKPVLKPTVLLLLLLLQTYYLPASAFKQQLTAITETAVVGSRLFFDYITLQAMSAETFNPGFETLWLVSEDILERGGGWD
jgi:O-methyltransferase involved in polyketide biosynthesis